MFVLLFYCFFQYFWGIWYFKDGLLHDAAHYQLQFKCETQHLKHTHIHTQTRREQPVLSFRDTARRSVINHIISISHLCCLTFSMAHWWFMETWKPLWSQICLLTRTSSRTSHNLHSFKENTLISVYIGNPDLFAWAVVVTIYILVASSF